MTLTLALTCTLAASPAAAQPEAELWLDDLVGAKVPGRSAEKALMRLAAATLLGDRQGLEELPEKLAADTAPRMVFVTLGDGNAPARVLRGAGRGLVKAFEAIPEQAEAHFEKGFVPRYLKLDVVHEVEHLPAHDPKKSLDGERSLAGIAFERSLALAFLPEEVVAETLVNSDQRLRLKNVRRQPRAKAERDEISKLLEADAVPLFRFTASTYFTDGEHLARLYRGHRLYRAVTEDDLLEAARLAGDYLVHATGEDGRFVYSYRPKQNEEKDDYNILRHGGTTYSLLELYEATREKRYLEAAERAIGYLLRAIEPCPAGEATGSCLVEDGYVKLGGNGLAMIALAKHAEVTGKRDHLPVIDSLGSWILSIQAEDGELRVHKQSHPEGRKSPFVSRYYPGEALLALTRRPEPEPRWLDAAERGARWLIEVRDRGVSSAELDHDHWLLYALNELHRRRPNPIYLAHARRIAKAIVAAQNRKPIRADWLGSYYKPPRSTPTATRSEGIAAAYLLIRDFGRPVEAQVLLQALELGVRFQLQTQLRPESTMYLPDPQRAIGGFCRGLTNYEIRIDYVQHNISSLLLLRRILAEGGQP